jgi:hypothetical protein
MKKVLFQEYVLEILMYYLCGAYELLVIHMELKMYKDILRSVEMQLIIISKRQFKF